MILAAGDGPDLAAPHSLHQSEIASMNRMEATIFVSILGYM